MLARFHSAISTRNARGVTLVELVCCTAVVMALASVTIPVANTLVKRHKEMQLRRALREVRTALDKFEADVKRYPGIRANLLSTVNEEGYPEELDTLVQGVDLGDAAGTTLKYLRRIPVDPITGSTDWGTRSTRDQPDSLFSDGINIFDIHTKSDKVGLNGVPYREW